MSSVYFFLVAEASAISSAPNTMSRGTFFSRASTSTSITNSRFPAAAVTATSNPSQFRHQLRPLHVLERQRHQSSFQLQLQLPLGRAPQHTDVLLSPAFARGAHPHLGLLAGEALEVACLAQGPVEPRRRHLQPVVVQTFDLEYPAELPTYRGAILHADATGLVDEEPQQPAPVRRLQVDELVAHAGYDRRDHVFLVQIKNGPKPISCQPLLKAFEV